MKAAGATLVALACLASTDGPAAAQSAAASPLLPPDHWAYEAILRDLPDGAAVAVRGRRTITWCEAARALRLAGEGAEEGADRSRAALERLLEELPLTGAEPCALEAFGASGSAGGYQRTGHLLTSTGLEPADPSWGPPERADDVSAPSAAARLSAAAGRRFAGMVEGGHLAGDWQLEALQAVLAVGPVLLWGGRRPVGYGPGEGGGIVFGDARVDGAGVQLGRPLLGPWLLRHLGPFHLETVFARGGPSGQVKNPWLWSARASIQPHPRLLLGVNRGVLFGGEGNVGTTFRDLVYILIGKHAGGGSSLENQIVAVDVVYRPPLPVRTEAYLEWGFEDSAGAWRNAPGVLWGLAFTDLPGLEGTRVGVERTVFARSCCGNPRWYRHMFLHAGWTEDRRPLGHPLGGHGGEWLLYGSAGALEQRLQLRASVALRDRWSENLYAPDREGTSRAGSLAARWLGGRWQVGADLVLEAGDDWAEETLRATIRYSP